MCMCEYEGEGVPVDLCGHAHMCARVCTQACLPCKPWCLSAPLALLGCTSLQGCNARPHTWPHTLVKAPHVLAEARHALVKAPNALVKAPPGVQGKLHEAPLRHGGQHTPVGGRLQGRVLVGLGAAGEHEGAVPCHLQVWKGSAAVRRPAHAADAPQVCALGVLGLTALCACVRRRYCARRAGGGVFTGDCSECARATHACAKQGLTGQCLSYSLLYAA